MNMNIVLDIFVTKIELLKILTNVFQYLNIFKYLQIFKPKVTATYKSEDCA